MGGGTEDLRAESEGDAEIEAPVGSRSAPDGVGVADTGGPWGDGADEGPRAGPAVPANKLARDAACTHFVVPSGSTMSLGPSCPVFANCLS